MKKIQRQVDDWVKQYKVGYFKPLEILVGLIEEMGELAREVNNLFGPKKKKPTEEKKELASEMADIIFALACLANSLGIDLDKAFKQVMRKNKQRDKNRYERK